MGPFPQLAIFRRFGPLNMLNLLSLQAELTHLQNELKAVTNLDDMSPGPESKFSSSFLAMLKEMDRDEEKVEDSREVPPASAKSGRTPLQWSLLLRIRSKLNEYSEYVTRSTPNRLLREVSR